MFCFRIPLGYCVEPDCVVNKENCKPDNHEDFSEALVWATLVCADSALLSGPVLQTCYVIAESRDGQQPTVQLNRDDA